MVNNEHVQQRDKQEMDAFAELDPQRPEVVELVRRLGLKENVAKFAVRLISQMIIEKERESSKQLANVLLLLHDEFGVQKQDIDECLRRSM